MKKNMHNVDRIVRVLIGIVTTTLYMTDTVSGTLGLVLMIVGLILAATSFINFCPIYAALGISTLGKKKEETPVS